MTKDDALRIACAARSILHKRHAPRTCRDRMLDAASSFEVGNGLDVAQVFRQANQECPDLAQLRGNNEIADLSIAQNASLPAQMLFDLGAPERRIDGDGDPLR